MSSSHVISDQVFGSSRRVRFIGMSPMDSLLSAIDKAHHNHHQQPPPTPPMLPSLSSYLSSNNHSDRPQQKSPTMSIQSILDSPQQQEAAAAAAGLTKTEANVASLLANHPNSYLPPSPRMETVGMKRRQWSDAPFESQDDRAAKIRRCIREQIAGQHAKYPICDAPPSPPHTASVSNTRMTTITCLHAAVAQKSYGSEKRFLCPPPVVSIQSPANAQTDKTLERPSVAMSVICSEIGPDRTVGQRAILDETMTGSFKYLHVTGTAKAKQFQLRVNVSHARHANEPYATFDTNPINIISKPSKKTAKARNVSSCILSNSPVSLFNRINSQTVRTKYMTVERSQLCAKNSNWSAFSITVVRLAGASNGRMPSNVPVSYGAEIILTDLETGVSSEPLIIRKVEKGRIAQQAGGPVSQMQKVALQRVSSINSGTPSYLSAAGAFTDTVVDQSTNNANAFLGYENSRVIVNEATSPEGSAAVTVEEVDDYLCWTIVGIAKFQYSYFESLAPKQDEPQCKITPFPTLTTAVYKPGSHSLDLWTKDVAEGTEIWLGPHGPLHARRLQCAGIQEQYTVELPSTQDVIVTNHDLLTPDTHGSRSLELPILFVRADGVVYHSGRAVRCRVEENGDAGRWCLTEA
jgi:LAG1, DNA binding/Beta-trefoil DNA-binding domain